MSNAQPSAYSRKSWEAARRAMDERQASTHPVLATLYAEHRYMATLLKLLSEQLDLIERGEPGDFHVLYESLYYMTRFPDAFHHPREDLVYQRAGEIDHGIADSVDTLQRDHDYLTGLGEKCLVTARQWYDSAPGSQPSLEPLREYISTLYQHMNLEEQVVFPQIESLLSEQDWRELEDEELLQPSPDPVFGPMVGREYRNVARKARRALRRGVEDVTLVEWIGLEALLEGAELLSMAADGSRAVAREHFEAAREEALEMLSSPRQHGGLLVVPWRCLSNNTRHYVGFLKDVGGIGRETLGDLADLGRGVGQRVRLVRSKSPSDARH